MRLHAGVLLCDAQMRYYGMEYLVFLGSGFCSLGWLCLGRALMGRLSGCSHIACQPRWQLLPGPLYHCVQAACAQLLLRLQSRNPAVEKPRLYRARLSKLL